MAASRGRASGFGCSGFRISFPVVNIVVTPRSALSSSLSTITIAREDCDGTGETSSVELNGRHGRQNVVGAVGIAFDVSLARDTGQHEDGFHAGFHPRYDVGIHAVADHDGALGVCPQVV